MKQCIRNKRKAGMRAKTAAGMRMITTLALGAACVAGANPIFPYFYKKFDGHEQKIKELGYTPAPHLLTTLNSSAETPYNLAHVTNWIRVMKKSAPGFVWVKMDDVNNEDVVLRNIRDVADVAAENGFTVVLYPYFGTAVPTAEAALPWVEKINRGNVGLTLHLPQEIKAGNARRFPEIIAKVKDRIQLVIICGADLPKEGDRPAKWGWDRLVRPLGEGDFDVAAFVREVRSSGYTGYFGQICWGIERPALEYLPSSMALWKSIP